LYQSGQEEREEEFITRDSREYRKEEKSSVQYLNEGKLSLRDIQQIMRKAREQVESERKAERTASSSGEEESEKESKQTPLPTATTLGKQNPSRSKPTPLSRTPSPFITFPTNPGSNIPGSSRAVPSQPGSPHLSGMPSQPGSNLQSRSPSPPGSPPGSPMAAAAQQNPGGPKPFKFSSPKTFYGDPKHYQP
jgi:hypothetical protein